MLYCPEQLLKWWALNLSRRHGGKPKEMMRMLTNSHRVMRPESAKELDMGYKKPSEWMKQIEFIRKDAQFSVKRWPSEMNKSLYTKNYTNTSQPLILFSGQLCQNSSCFLSSQGWTDVLQFTLNSRPIRFQDLGKPSSCMYNLCPALIPHLSGSFLMHRAQDGTRSGDGTNPFLSWRESPYPTICSQTRRVKENLNRGTCWATATRTQRPRRKKEKEEKWEQLAWAPSSRMKQHCKWNQMETEKRRK